MTKYCFKRHRDIPSAVNFHLPTCYILLIMSSITWCPWEDNRTKGGVKSENRGNIIGKQLFQKNSKNLL